MDSIVEVKGAAEHSLREKQTASLVEDMDSDLLQEQTQSICEELQRRGACTTLALARHLGFEKSSAVNHLMLLLLEKNVVMSVSDFPPIWSLSPSFPLSPHFGATQSPSTHTPLTLGFPPHLTLGFPPVSCVDPLFRRSPMLEARVPASVTPTPAHIATLTETPASAIAIPASISPVLIGTEDALEEPAPLQSSAIPAKTRTLIASSNVTPVSAPLQISIPVSRTIDPIPASSSAPKPTSTSTATTLDPSQDPSPEFIVSRTALTFLEHVIPVPKEDSQDKGEAEDVVSRTELTFLEHVVPVPEEGSEENDEDSDEDEDEVFVEKTYPRTPLPALTFTEHLVPQTYEESKVSVIVGNAAGIKPHLLVTPTAATTLDAGHGDRHRKRRKKKQNVRRNQSRYFQQPVKSEDQSYHQIPPDPKQSFLYQSLIS